MIAKVAIAFLCAVAAAAGPWLVSDFWVFVFIEILVFGLYAVSFNLLLGYAGMLAFGHAVFFGIGAYVLAILMKKAELGPLSAALLAPWVTAIAGAVIGYFCIRLSGIYLGMLTFAFQMLVYTVVLKSYDFTGGDDGLSGLNSAGFAASPRGFYYVALAVVAGALFLLWRITRSPFGLALQAQRGNARRSAALGMNVSLHRWLTFVIAAFFAGLAGALFALANHNVFPGWINWTASATPIVMTILGGMHSFVGPIVGSVIYVLMQTWLTGLTEYWALFLGITIILLVILLPNGVMGLLDSQTMSEKILRLVALNKAFGGLRATRDVSLDVTQGEFRAIIGPNGAGKSTLFNLVSGFVAPDSGRIFLGSDDVTEGKPHSLFRAGLSRTFQITSIFADLSVLANLQFALLSHHRRLFDVFRQAGRMELNDCRRLLELVNLDVDPGRKAGTLSHGDQKKLELAVALAGTPRLLLLDEPTAGMAANERLESIRTVHRIAKKLGLTVVFTEHDMQVVFSVADRISVLHQGAIVADDVPEQIRRSRQVQQIYLGETAEGAEP